MPNIALDELYVVDPCATDEEIDQVLDKMKEMRKQGERTFIVCPGCTMEVKDA